MSRNMKMGLGSFGNSMKPKFDFSTLISTPYKLKNLAIVLR